VQASDRVTIADVAGASGVGIGTVSRVINGAANVRQATRAKVLKVIEQLGYRPSHLATALSRGTSRTVAIVVPHVTRPSAVERVAGALAVLAERGYATIVCNVDTASQRDQHLAALTARHRADGVIVMSLALSPDHLTSFRRANVPLVTVDVAARAGLYDDIKSASLLRLSTVRQPLQESGAKGARRLCALLRGERVLPLRQVLPIEVVQRGSSGRPAGQSRQTFCRSGSHSSLNSALEAR
jgi:DNA-binding LacI/PurR family transcriptional regulator